MPDGKAFMEELRKILEDEEKPIPTKQMNRLIITGIIALDNKLDSVRESTANEIKKLQTEVPNKWLTRNWKGILFAATTFFLIIHSLVPADVSLWSWFSKLIGGP